MRSHCIRGLGLGLALGVLGVLGACAVAPREPRCPACPSTPSPSSRQAAAPAAPSARGAQPSLCESPWPSASAASPARAAEGHASAAPVVAARLRVVVRPKALPTARVEVEIVACADGARLASWSMDRLPGPTGGELEVRARDDAGELELRRADGASRHRRTLARSPQGPLRLAYELSASERDPGELRALVVAADHFYAAAETALLLPDALDREPVALDLEIDAEGVAAPVVASSLGLGAHRHSVALGLELRQLSLLAGSLGTAVLDAYEGHDEAAWTGYTAFDPRLFVAELAETRSAMRQFFGDKQDTPASVLLLSGPRPRGSMVVGRRAAGLVGFVGIDEPWAGPLRLAFAQQLCHTWIGGQLWIGPDDGVHAAESRWFTEGFARYYARELLFRYGQLEPKDVLDEVNAELAVLAGSPLGRASNAELAARDAEPGAHAVLVARGALYAARVNALVRARSKGKRSLDPLVLGLLSEARRRGAALPVSAWLDAVGTELGSEAPLEYQRLILQGAPLELPDDALGPCFRRTRLSEAVFGLGFALEPTRAATPQRLVGLEPRGPAARAGARPDDVLERLDFAPGRPDVPVVLQLRRGAAVRTVRYAPVTASVPYQGWARKPGIRDEACGR